MRILFLSRWFPYPPTNGSCLRIYHLLTGLATAHEVTLLSFMEAAAGAPVPPELSRLCTVLPPVPWKPFAPNRWAARRGWLSWQPSSVVDTYSAPMAQAITQELATRSFDLVIASQLTTAGYVHEFAGLPALFEEVELGLMMALYRQAGSLSARFRKRLTWFKHRRYVTQVLRHFQAATVVSAQERQLVSAAVPGYQPLTVIPNCVDLADYAHRPATPTPYTLIFTGSFRYVANYEAMLWFLREIFPRVQAALPQSQLIITGDHAHRPLPSAPNLRLTGQVPDVRPLLAGSWCSIVPLLSGGGTRVKILEAMALRTPVITTTKGAEGLAVQPGVHLLVADTPQTFSAAVIRLLGDPGLRRDLADNAYQLVSTTYDWATTLPRFLQVVNQVGKTPSGCRPEPNQ